MRFQIASLPILTAAILVATQGRAAPADGANASSAPDEIIVTAQHRQRNEHLGGVGDPAAVGGVTDGAGRVGELVGAQVEDVALDHVGSGGFCRQRSLRRDGHADGRAFPARLAMSVGVKGCSQRQQ